jgi:hypothetical protein
MTQESIDVEPFVKHMAAIVDLRLRPEHQPGVIENFTQIAEIAQLVMEFSLPETTEAAPIFDPGAPQQR